jgi:hypothetical protein
LKTQAWHQAYAIVPDDIPPNMLASITYDQFAISPKVDRRFFWWLSHSPYFTETVRSSASGVVIEKMVFDREAWLGKKIPLPVLEEQQTIVARIEELVSKVNKARAIRHQTKEEMEALIATASDKRFSEVGSTEPLGYLIAEGIAISYGVLVPGPEVESGIPFIRIQDLSVRGDISLFCCSLTVDDHCGTWYEGTTGVAHAAGNRAGVGCLAIDRQGVQGNCENSEQVPSGCGRNVPHSLGP